MKKGTETISWHCAFNAFKEYSGGNKNHKSIENTQGWPKWCVVVQNSYLSSHPALTATPSFTPHPTQWIIPAPLNTVVSRIYLLFHQYFTRQLSALKLACHEILLTQRCPELRLVSVSAISALPSLANIDEKTLTCESPSFEIYGAKKVSVVVSFNKQDFTRFKCRYPESGESGISSQRFLSGAYL